MIFKLGYTVKTTPKDRTFSVVFFCDNRKLEAQFYSLLTEEGYSTNLVTSFCHLANCQSPVHYSASRSLSTIV